MNRARHSRALQISFTPTNGLFKPGLYVEHPTVRNYVYTMGQDNPFVRYFWHQISNRIPPVVLYYVFKRYLVSGLVSGAVSVT
jgi:hypothetical protein